MAKFKVGVPRAANAGRKKGTPNKKTQDFMQMLEAKGFDPGAAYVDLFQKQMKVFTEFRARHPNSHAPTQAELLAKASISLNNICQYVYPKKKAVEHSGEVGVRTFADFMAAAKGGSK